MMFTIRIFWIPRILFRCVPTSLGLVTSNGLGTKVKQAKPKLLEDKAIIWGNVWGNRSAESSQCTMFFYSFKKLSGPRGHADAV